MKSMEPSTFTSRAQDRAKGANQLRVLPRLDEGLVVLDRPDVTMMERVGGFGGDWRQVRRDVVYDRGARRVVCYRHPDGAIDWTMKEPPSVLVERVTALFADATA